MLEKSLLSNTKKYLIAGLLLIFGNTILFATLPPFKTGALSGSDFNPGRVIDDAIFYDGNSMSQSQIQNFLNSKNPSCDTSGSKSYSYYYNSKTGRVNNNKDTWVTTSRATYGQRVHKYLGSSYGSQAPFVCLKDYKQNTTDIAPESGICKGYSGALNESAARIINKVAKSCGISPKVLIVMLEKEQSLVTDDWPWGRQYDKAMGAFCPDTAPCDSAYKGFFYQVYYGAHRFKVYKANPNNYNYKANRNNSILWHPNTSCGRSTVFIENQATAGLYIYTPYRPNQSALNNYPGAGNSCSSYGNRNFWFKFNEWFGPTVGEKILPIKYSTITDTSGKHAAIGIRLSKKPRHNVVIPISVSSPSNARINDDAKSITITPDNWNKPEKNLIKIIGKNNKNLVDTHMYWLRLGKPVSADDRYSIISEDNSPDIPLLHQKYISERNVYRLYSTNTRNHLFTSSADERLTLVAAGWRDEGVVFRYCASGEQTISRMYKNNSRQLVVERSEAQANASSNGYKTESLAFSSSGKGTIPVYWRYDEQLDRHLYTTSKTEGLSDGFIDKGVAFYACSNTDEAIFRLYKPGSSHFYTSSELEREKAIGLGYRYEGIGFYSCISGTSDVYRLIKESSGVRFYTSSELEREKAIGLGYRYEGVDFSACSTKGKRNVYRLYNQKNGRRFYTVHSTERDDAVRNHGYRYEGVGFIVR